MQPLAAASRAERGAPSAQLGRIELWAHEPGQAGYSKVAIDTTPTTTRSFSYSPGNGAGTYRFYTRARDKAGNYETAPAAPDATTVVGP